MKLQHIVMSALAGILLIGAALAGGASAVTSAAGVVEKADKESVSVQPRGADGKFGKKLVLKLTGTSKLSLVTHEKRGGKLVAVQRDVEAKDLEANQPIVVIYTSGAGDPILLSGVVQHAKDK